MTPKQIIIILFFLFFSLVIFFYWFTMPEQTCMRICGYNPFTGMGGGICLDFKETCKGNPSCIAELCHYEGGVYIQPDCCCICVLR